MRSSTSLCICLCLALLSCVHTASGQACGAYYITVSVKDGAGKPVKNARVLLRPIEKDESGGRQFARDKEDPSTSSLKLSEGISFKFFHRISVSAPGFRSADLDAKFLSCASRTVVVKLGKTRPAVWQFTNTVEVEASASGSKKIDGLKLTVIDSQGRSKDVPVQTWFAFVDLSNGEYIFRLSAPGYETVEEKVDLTRLENKTLKVELMRKG
jgi:hypothetical protein